ncbi:hypothetical protein [Argonema antarcticum]|uniref:hypothetical protein n=1 Tax=Argonema antarcticum TaxID=2942763 RepID=UPI0020136333|nr:hypothetical protein [Argonema antarcticum]MCL1472820.1 hypothetical protein [Argonema antarcticum A004/B2]
MGHLQDCSRQPFYLCIERHQNLYRFGMNLDGVVSRQWSVVSGQLSVVSCQWSFSLPLFRSPTPPLALFDF